MENLRKYFDINTVFEIELASDIPANAKKVDINNTSLLMHACFYNLKNAVQNLIINFADVNHVDTFWLTPLKIACYCNNLSIVKILVENGADVNFVCDKFPKNAIMLVLSSGSKGIYDYLINNGAIAPLFPPNYNLELDALLLESIKVFDNTRSMKMIGQLQNINKLINLDGDNLLMYSLEHQNFEICRYLIQKNIDVEHINYNGCTIKTNIVRACADFHQLYRFETNNLPGVFEFLFFLIEKKHVSACFFDGVKSLMYIAVKQHIYTLVRLLLYSQKGHIDELDDFDVHLGLWLLCDIEIFKVVSFQCVINFNFRDEYGRSFMDRVHFIDNNVIRNRTEFNQNDKFLNFYEKVDYLIANGFALNEHCGSMTTTLARVCIEKDAEKIRYLIKRGASPNSKGSNGFTPLMYETTSEIYSLLIDSGADVLVEDNDGLTALKHAFIRANMDLCVQLYLLNPSQDITFMPMAREIREQEFVRYSANRPNHKRAALYYFFIKKGAIIPVYLKSAVKELNDVLQNGRVSQSLLVLTSFKYLKQIGVNSSIGKLPIELIKEVKKFF